MKRKKSTQLLAVALTAAMLAQPVGAQMVFAEGNADAVQQEQAVSRRQRQREQFLRVELQ